MWRFTCDNYCFRNIEEEQEMKKVINFFCRYSNRILLCAFLAYFLFLEGLNCLNIEIVDIYGFVFFLLLGLYLGNLIALKVSEYQRKNKK